MDSLQPFQRSEYEDYFSAADAAFRNGRVDSTQKGRKHVGNISVHLSDLWECSLDYRMPHTSSELCASQDSQLAYAWATMVKENRLQLAQYLGHSRPLARRSIRPMKAIPQNLRAKNLSINIGTNDGRIEEGGSTH